MAQSGLLALLLLLAAAACASASVFDVLYDYGLPSGLLPHTVTSYKLSDSGEFSVELAGETYCTFEDKVYYEKQITGTLSYGAIKNLSGIKAKQSIFWFSVTGIRVDVPSTGFIYFDVGFVSKKLSLTLFEGVPTCTKGAEVADQDLGLSFASWLDQALSGKLTVNAPNNLNRKFAQTA